MAGGVIDSFKADNRWLSNFWPVTVVYNGILFPTVEHAYVAAKVTDRATQETIAKLSSPGAAKRAGRALKLRPDWDAVKLEIMRDLIEQKFSQVAMRRLLMATGDAELIEGNVWGDTFWGVCDGVGENHLGKLIMAARARWMAELAP